MTETAAALHPATEMEGINAGRATRVLQLTLKIFQVLTHPMMEVLDFPFAFRFSVGMST